MAPLYLSHDTYVCEVDDNAIFLSLSHNRYISVDSDSLSQLRRSVTGWPASTSITEDHNQRDPAIRPATLDDLVRSNLLTTSTCRGKPAYQPRIRIDDSIFDIQRPDAPTRATIGDFLRLVTCLFDVSVRLKLGLLGSLVRSLGREPHDFSQSAPNELLQLTFSRLSAYLRLRPWLFSAKDACLKDSLTLAKFLHRSGLPATFVIGVKIKPFGAHAWVQLDSHVLNDNAEIVNQYTPILSM